MIGYAYIRFFETPNMGVKVIYSIDDHVEQNAVVNGKVKIDDEVIKSKIKASQDSYSVKWTPDIGLNTLEITAKDCGYTLEYYCSSDTEDVDLTWNIDITRDKEGEKVVVHTIKYKESSWNSYATVTKKIKYDQKQYIFIGP
jgi:hypothetical protein